MENLGRNMAYFLKCIEAGKMQGVERPLRVRTAAATMWAERKARINSISPGIIVTPLAYDEFNAAGEGYQKMIEASPAKRVGTADEIAAAGAFLLGDETGFITGIDLLIDGGVIAAMNSGKYSLGQ